MSEERAIWQWDTSPPMDVGSYPPLVAIAGFPPLPGESWRAYTERVKRDVLKIHGYNDETAGKCIRPSRWQRFLARLRSVPPALQYLIGGLVAMAVLAAAVVVGGMVAG